MRRLFTATISAGLLTVGVAGTALGAHCVNESKKADAGQLGDVVINVITGEVTYVGANPAGRLPGGFGDVWLDFDGDGTGDALAVDDTFLVSNHSHRDNPGQGVPGVLPNILRGENPGGEGHGVGSAG
jgi:hypothetical protein